MHFVLRSSVFPIKDVRNLDFPDVTEENPQEHCQNKRSTLMSPQECKIARCTQNQIEAPYVFDWENAFALHTMQGNRASSRGEAEVS